MVTIKFCSRYDKYNFIRWKGNMASWLNRRKWTYQWPPVPVRPIARPGCRSSVSNDTLRRELLRQATAERRRLKARRSLYHAIVVLYASPLWSAMHAANRFKKVVVSFLAPPVAENTSGVNAALSTSRTLSSYRSRFSFSCRRYVDGGAVRGSEWAVHRIDSSAHAPPPSRSHRHTW